jgi:hypothetical protein
MARTNRAGSLPIPPSVNSGSRSRPRGKLHPVAGLVAQPELPFDLSPGGSPPAHDARTVLERKLSASLGAPLIVTVTDNRRTMVSIQKKRGISHVRVHHMFSDAPAEIVEALGRYLGRGDRFASRLIDRYIAANQTRIRTDCPSRRTLRPRGTYFDLQEIQRSLSDRYFQGRVWLDITWGRKSAHRQHGHARHTIRMGTYFIEEQLIRIHPALDQAFVPRYFLEWVVYHEMLHHVVPMPEINGRRVYHSNEFRLRERMFEQYERARTWERDNLRRLIATRHGL